MKYCKLGKKTVKNLKNEDCTAKDSCASIIVHNHDQQEIHAGTNLKKLFIKM